MAKPEQRKVIPILIAGFRIDASISERHSYQAEATEFPVESGSTISDNIRNLPIEVSIEGIVSNTPLGELATVRGEGGDVTLNDGSVVPAQTPVELARAKFEGIWRARQPITIITTLDTYKNMVMTSLEIPRTASDGGADAYRFSATFRQVTIVTTERISVTVATPVARKKKKIGGQPSPTGPITRDPNAGPAVVMETSDGTLYYDEDVSSWRKGAVKDSRRPGGYRFNKGDLVSVDDRELTGATFDSVQATDDGVPGDPTYDPLDVSGVPDGG
jgi:hypothetical protein